MPRIPKFELALPTIEAFFDNAPAQQRVFNSRELMQLLNLHRDDWDLPASVSSHGLIERLMKGSHLSRTTLSSESYQSITRYIWRTATPYQVALSLRPAAYLTHGSAVFLHGLNDQRPSSIYVNKEQSPKAPSSGSMTQEGIDRAFATAQRRSMYEFLYRRNRIVILSGKNTRRLEVIPIQAEDGTNLVVTSLPRTLIDIAVRPVYAGGVFQVLEAYEGARDRVGVNAIVATLKALEYKYPYHQAIGFYLSRAGVEHRRLQRLKSLGLEYDFYLDYAIPEDNRAYDKEWRLFFPKGL